MNSDHRKFVPTRSAPCTCFTTRPAVACKLHRTRGPRCAGCDGLLEQYPCDLCGLQDAPREAHRGQAPRRAGRLAQREPPGQVFSWRDFNRLIGTRRPDLRRTHARPETWQPGQCRSCPARVPKGQSWCSQECFRHWCVAINDMVRLDNDREDAMRARRLDEEREREAAELGLEGRPGLERTPAHYEYGVGRELKLVWKKRERTFQRVWVPQRERCWRPPQTQPRPIPDSAGIDKAARTAALYEASLRVWDRLKAR